MRNRRSPARRTRVGQEVAGPRVVEADEYVPSRRPRLPEIWPWLLLLLLLVIGGLFAAYFLTLADDNKKSSTSAVTVPAVVGLKESRVVKQLDERGLVPQLATGPSKFPAGTVFAQDPGAGTSLNRGSLVKVSVSSAADIGAERRRLDDIRRGLAPESRRLAISDDDGAGYGCAGCGRRADAGGGDESRERLDGCAARLEGRDQRARRAP